MLKTLSSISRYVIFSFTALSSASQHYHRFHNIVIDGDRFHTTYVVYFLTRNNFGEGNACWTLPSLFVFLASFPRSKCPISIYQSMKPLEALEGEK